MIHLISHKVACFLCSKDDAQTTELYEYAVYIVLSSAFHIAAVVILGVLFNALAESLIFYASFVAIRKFAGGYHAQTPARCFLFSMVTIITGLFLIRIFCIYYSGAVIALLYAAAAAQITVMWLFSPEDTPNNRLSTAEKKHYRICSLVISATLLAIFTLFTILNITFVSVPIVLGMFLSGVVLIMRKIQTLHQ